jgi:hypothetical protein
MYWSPIVLNNLLVKLSRLLHLDLSEASMRTGLGIVSACVWVVRVLWVTCPSVQLVSQLGHVGWKVGGLIRQG